LHTPSDAEALVALGWSDHFARQLAAPDHHLTPARVCAQHRGRLQLIGPDGPLDVPTPRRPSLPDDPVDPALCVGDWVLFERAPEGPRLVRALTRRTRLARKQSGARSRPQLIGVNLDRVFLVTSMNADFSPRRLERYLAAVLAGGAAPAVVLTKADLSPAEIPRYRAAASAAAPSAAVVVTSALTGRGLDALDALLAPGQTVAFVGSSGAGKSTLVNALMGEDVMRVEGLRERDGTGQHTTTHRALLPVPGGRGVLMDTPGMREFQPWSGAALGEVFDDLEALTERCRYRDCRHDGEPGCAVAEALERGAVTAGRVKNWGKLKREAERLEGRVSDWEQRRARKRFARQIRATQRRKRRG